MHRTDHRFPTRSYPYREGPPKETTTWALAAESWLESGGVHRLVMGIDAPPPRPMNPSQIGELLRDSFAELLLKRGNFPLSLRALLGAFDAMNDDPSGLPEQVSYVVADGGQIPWSPETAPLNRQFRFVLTRARGAEVNVLISASTVLDSQDQFLQVLAWDPVNRVYNYYERRLGTWIWAGHSHHALEPDTRGRGPFDSHVNGSLVMKELKFPWTHWHSMSASIDSALATDDPLRSEPLFRNKAGAQGLERVVKAGVIRWNKARLDKTIAADGTVRDVPYLMRQILETTTVNLASSEEESNLAREGAPLRLPLTFFLHSDALLNEIGLEPDIERINVDGRMYTRSLQRYDFTLMDGDFRKKGDTFFAFLVPEPAFEDLDVLSQLLERKILTPHFAASLLMVDFTNPIFSPRRRRLMKYVPGSACLTATSSDLSSTMVAAMEAVEHKLRPESPEREFLANWRLPTEDWKAAFERRIEGYFEAVAAKAKTEEGFDGFVRLADSRRREFRKRPLAEFPLTLPTTNIPKHAPFLAMSEDGTVQSTSRRPS